MEERTTIDKSRHIHTWGEFCEIIKGNGVQKVDFVDEGYGCIHYGQIYTHYGPYTYNTNKFVSKEIFDKAKKASKGDIIMTDTSENVEDICKSVAYLGNDDIAVSNHALIIKHNQNPKFLSYSTQTDSFFNQKRKVVVGVKVSGIKPEQLAKIKIYLPSLSEQERIVDILDTFTSSIENLKQQIDQRRKQYNWYLDQVYYSDKHELLEASEKGEIEVKTFDEIGTFTRGRRFVRTDIVPEGVPCIHYGDMYTYYGVCADKTPTHITREKAAKLRFASNGDVIIVAAGENDIDIGVGVAWLGKENVVVHDACFIFKHNMNPKYISYYLRSMNYHLQIRMGVVDGKICSISAKELGRTLMPVRSLEEQTRIVSSLDTIDACIRNLEAQLSQREKQYEYYRNKMLTFED